MGDRKPSFKPKCTKHQEEIRLFCKECQDVLCIECMLEKHQKHSVAKFSEAIDSIKQIIETWRTKEVTSGFEAKKRQLQISMETSKLAHMTAESELRKGENDLKKKISKEANVLSQKLAEAFKKYDFRLQQGINEINKIKKIMETFDIDSSSIDETLQLYCRLKLFESSELQSKINEIELPRLCLSQNPDFAFASILPDPDEERMSQVAKSSGKDSMGDTKLYPRHFSIDYSQIATSLQITKIVPIDNEKAWVLSCPFVYYLNNAKLSQVDNSIYTCMCWSGVNDIAGSENNIVYAMSNESRQIAQIALKGSATLFTRTDPYLPKCLTYIKNNHTLIVLMDKNIILTFGTDGIKNQQIDLGFKCDGKCMEAFSCHDISLVATTLNRYFITRHSETASSPIVFRGLYGSEPSLSFQCGGICYDDKRNLIIGDSSFNTIYRLDNDMKLQKVLIDKQGGLDRLTALAFFNGYLFIAQFDKMSIYRYSDLE